MAQAAIADFYKTRAWKNARAAYKASVGGLCEKCLEAGIVRAGEFVHHKIHLNADNINDPDITLSFDNMRLLCRACHAAEHSKRRYSIDPEGFVHTK